MGRELHAINAKLLCLPVLAERVKRIEPQVEAFARLRQPTIGAAAGNMSEAARRLGISRNTLYRRFKRGKMP